MDFIDEHYERASLTRRLDTAVKTVSKESKKFKKSVSRESVHETVSQPKQQQPQHGQTKKTVTEYVSDVSARNENRKRRKIINSADGANGISTPNSPDAPNVPDVATADVGTAYDSDNEFHDSFNVNDVDLPEIPVNDKKIKAEILNVLSAWLGDMNYQMQQSFQERFDEATERVKSEVLEYVDSTEKTETGASALEESISYHAKDIDYLMNKNRGLQDRCRVLEGRLTRVEKELQEVKEEQLMQQARSMRENIKFQNIPEVEDGRENCQDTILKFLKYEVRIQGSDIEKIKFERIHRTGRKIPNLNRVMIGKVNSE